MIWLTSKWTKLGGLVLAFMMWLSIRDRGVKRKINLDNKVKDYENANRIRRRVDAARELHDSERVIEYRDG